MVDKEKGKEKEEPVRPESDSGKPEGWDETLDDLIRSGLTYEDANKALKIRFGVAGTLGGLAYREHKNKLVGGEKVDEGIEKLSSRKRAKKPKEEVKVTWTKQKQTAADGSKLAQIINMGIFSGAAPFCANRELKPDDVEEINLGGAIVANLQYYFPGQNMEHPLIILGIRVVIFYIKFKSVCGKMVKRPKTETVGGEQSGLKPGMMTERRG